jgi:hypothetical protein
MKNMYKEVGGVVRTVEDVVTQTDHVFGAYRQSVFKRFPILFALLVGFGGATTFYGIERVIAEMPWLNDRPFLILFVGLTALTLTGRLYKKLSE